MKKPAVDDEHTVPELDSVTSVVGLHIEVLSVDAVMVDCAIYFVALKKREEVAYVKWKGKKKKVDECPPMVMAILLLVPWLRDMKCYSE